MANSGTLLTRPDQTRPDQTRPDQTRPDRCLCSKFLLRTSEDSGNGNDSFVSFFSP